MHRISTGQRNFSTRLAQLSLDFWHNDTRNWKQSHSESVIRIGNSTQMSASVSMSWFFVLRQRIANEDHPVPFLVSSPCPFAALTRYFESFLSLPSLPWNYADRVVSNRSRDLRERSRKRERRTLPRSEKVFERTSTGLNWPSPVFLTWNLNWHADSMSYRK